MHVRIIELNIYAMASRLSGREFRLFHDEHNPQTKLLCESELRYRHRLLPDCKLFRIDGPILINRTHTYHTKGSIKLVSEKFLTT